MCIKLSNIEHYVSKMNGWPILVTELWPCSLPLRHLHGDDICRLPFKTGECKIYQHARSALQPQADFEEAQFIF